MSNLDLNLQILRSSRRIVGQEPRRDDAKDMDRHLGDEDHDFLFVLFVRQVVLLVHYIRDANSQTYDENDNENDETDQQIPANLAPDREDCPDDDGAEEHTKCDVRNVRPFDFVKEETHGVTNDVIVEERADQRTMINGQEDLESRILEHDEFSVRSLDV